MEAMKLAYEENAGEILRLLTGLVPEGYKLEIIVRYGEIIAYEGDDEIVRLKFDDTEACMITLKLQAIEAIAGYLHRTF